MHIFVSIIFQCIEDQSNIFSIYNNFILIISIFPKLAASFKYQVNGNIQNNFEINLTLYITYTLE